jgi:NodT family efflux transporter outer membrane factor (OMF) lipoprotein
MKVFFPAVGLTLAALLLGGCVNLSPGYAPPAVTDKMPRQYKEEGGWKTAGPTESLNSGSWWEMFGEPVLNDLMLKANTANQNIAVAAANLRKARAQIAAAQSALMPGFSLPASATRSVAGETGVQTRYSAGISAQWELSFWNALPLFEAAKAQAEASAADYAAMRLSVQSDVAQTYFQLRTLDVQRSLYESSIAAYAKAVQLTRSQYQGGMVTLTDVAQAETQLASTEAQLAAIERQRAELEHGIAILTGQMPSLFSLPPASLEARLPQIPAGLPSTLLERRPDVASAERQVAAANEQIGQARAAWFPSLSLGADRLTQGVGWHSAPLLAWSLGPSAALSLFQGGRHLAESDAAWAAYEAQVANYRQISLQAFKEVEDNLSSLRLLKKENEAQDRAVLSSRTALRMSLSQYREGMITYLQVVSTQTAALTNESNAIRARGQSLIAAVNLVKALGGGWQASDIRDLVTGAIP